MRERPFFRKCNVNPRLVLCSHIISILNNKDVKVHTKKWLVLMNIIYKIYKVLHEITDTCVKGDDLTLLA